MLFLTVNKADDGDWSSLYGSAPDFPVINLQNTQAYRVWRSTEDHATDQLDLDLGAETVPAVKWYLVIHAHNLSSGQAVTVTWSGGVSTTPGTTTLQVADFPDGPLYFEVPAVSAGAPDWRLAFPSANLDGDPAQIGRVYLGPAVDTGTRGAPDYAGFSDERIDPSLIDFTPGGQAFIERKRQYEEIDLDFSYMPESIQTLVRALYRSLGAVDPFFIRVATTAPLNRFIYVRFDSKFPEKIKAYTGSFIWSNKLHLREQL